MSQEATPPPLLPPSEPTDRYSGIIPYKNTPALIAYYLGVFSAIPLVGIPLGLAAVVLGIIGLIKVSHQPQVKGTGHAIAGIVCGLTLQAGVMLGIYLLVR